MVISGRSVQLEHLDRLAVFLRSRRASMLSAWRRKVNDDPDVTASSALARAQFVDHIPRILDAFERRLRARNAREADAATAAERAGAAEHGVHRWLHGYNYRETMREWGHLQVSLTDEMEAFVLANPSLDSVAMSEARQQATQLFVECVVESAVGHASLQEAEAASRLTDLERVLDQVRTVERARAELWHEVTHDLRGNVSAVKLAATALVRSDTGPIAPRAVTAIQASAAALGLLLNDLIELTRLEAGREDRLIAQFDVAAVLREIAAGFQPMAAERHLFLKIEGPASLPACGDAAKVRRIVQNLVINALKYTERGGVQLLFGMIENSEVPSWTCSIQDTGVGLTEGEVTPLARVLGEATDEDRVVAREAAAKNANNPPPRSVTARTLPSASTERAETLESSEGIGLTIVKRLCELLDATIELHSSVGRGTTFRLVFPLAYS